MPKATYKRRPDGRYRVVYNGQEFYSTPGGPLSEAVQKRDEYKKQLALGLKEERLGTLFSAYASRYMQVHKADCTRQTYNQYVSYLNKAISFFGADMRMQDITVTDIKALYNHVADGYGKHSIDKFAFVIKGVFRTAVNDGVILRNPCEMVKKPKDLHKGSHRTITDEERAMIHESVGEHPMALAAMIMLYAGLRRGEVMYIDADRDIDHDDQRIYVKKAIHFERNQPEISHTKSKAGVRSIPLFGPLPELLKQHSGLILQKQAGGIVSRTVFRNQWASYMHHLSRKANGGIQKRWYGKTKAHKAILAAGGKLPPWKEVKFTPHDLRHSFVTMLYDADVDIKTAVKWAGHADAKMIMEIYAHLTEQREKRAENDARKHVENLLKGSNGGSDNS